MEEVLAAGDGAVRLDDKGELVIGPLPATRRWPNRPLGGPVILSVGAPSGLRLRDRVFLRVWQVAGVAWLRERLDILG